MRNWLGVQDLTADLTSMIACAIYPSRSCSSAHDLDLHPEFRFKCVPFIYALTGAQ